MCSRFLSLATFADTSKVESSVFASVTAPYAVDVEEFLGGWQPFFAVVALLLLVAFCHLSSCLFGGLLEGLLLYLQAKLLCCTGL